MTMLASRPLIALVGAAALSMMATPATARGWHRYHDRGIDGGDVIAGVVILGGIAAIASAIGNSAKDKRARDARYPEDTRYPASYPNTRDDRDYPDYPPQQGGYGDNRDDGQVTGYGETDRGGAFSMDGAVDACVDEVERGSSRVDTVDAVNRDGDGWRVDGRIGNGRDFTCSVDGDGRIRRVAVDGRAAF